MLVEPAAQGGDDAGRVRPQCGHIDERGILGLRAQSRGEVGDPLGYHRDHHRLPARDSVPDEGHDRIQEALPPAYNSASCR